MLQCAWKCKNLSEILFLFLLGKYPEVEWLDHMVFLFLIFEKLPHCFPCGCTNLHPHQPCTRVPFFPQLHQHFLSLVFFMIVILTGERWHLITALICISLTISDFEHIFMDLLAICISLENVICFFVLNHVCSLYTLDINPLSDRWFPNISSHLIGWLFILLVISFVMLSISTIGLNARIDWVLNLSNRK